jgi:pyridoxine kinase
MNSKKLLAIHDLSGIGHTSLMAVVPIMYHYAIQTAMLPTSLLSTNTCYPDYYMQDSTDIMHNIMHHWRKLGMKFSCIYSGFLGSHEQVDVLIEATQTLAEDGCMVVVDPVLADDGKLYSCYDNNMVIAMKKAIAIADLITPNYTEACLLTDTLYQSLPQETEILAMCQHMCASGTNKVIITSVPADKGTKSYYYDSASGSLQCFECRYIPAFYPGTGDVFASLVIAMLLNGEDIVTAIKFATGFIYDAINKTLSIGRDHREGICLDIMLKSVP